MGTFIFIVEINYFYSYGTKSESKCKYSIMNISSVSCTFHTFDAYFWSKCSSNFIDFSEVGVHQAKPTTSTINPSQGSPIFSCSYPLKLYAKIFPLCCNLHENKIIFSKMMNLDMKTLEMMCAHI
jgi:hypothetical protein